VDGLRKARRSRDMRFHNLEDEEVVFRDETSVRDAALEIGVTLVDERRLHFHGRRRGQSENLELVDVGTGGVADADDLGRKIDRRNVDHALATSANHLEAVAVIADDATDQRRRELHDGMPTVRHDVRASTPARADENDRPWLEKPSDLGDWKVALRVVLDAHRCARDPYRCTNVRENRHVTSTDVHRSRPCIPRSVCE